MLKSQRSCAICRVKKDKKELFRFVVMGGEVLFDKEQKMSARGLYICSKECWESAKAKRRKVKYSSVAKPAKMVGLPDKGFEEIVLL